MSPVDDVAALLDRSGAGRRRLRELLDAMTGPAGLPFDALVRDSALARRTVEELLAALGEDVTEGPDGLRIGPAHRYRERFGLPGLARTRVSDPIGARVAAAPDLTAALTRLVAAAPRPRRHLDQVAATPETLARRGYWLDATYDLGDIDLLCVGDHDLTSLAACLVNPAARVSVVDVDEGLLAFLDETARRHGWSIRCRYADLRFGLPGDLAGSADVVFTDPPYTPEGVGLFCVRGLQGLRDPVAGRVVVAYGSGDRSPALGLKVQRAMQSLQLNFEAILPAFSRYSGAQAVGSASDLYVCRPTPQTAKLLAGASTTVDGRIYTHGPQSLEAAPATLTEGLAARALELAAAGSPALVLGPGRDPAWRDTAPDAPRVALSKILSRGTGSLPPPPAGRDRTVVADLTDDPGGWLVRTLLAVNASRVVVLTGGDPGPLTGASRPGGAGVLAGKYTVAAVGGLVVATAVPAGSLDGPAALRRWLLDRAHGRLRNVWREGLTRLAGVSKNEARDRIAAAARPEVLDAALIDLPVELLAEVLVAAGKVA